MTRGKEHLLNVFCFCFCFFVLIFFNIFWWLLLFWSIFFKFVNHFSASVSRDLIFSVSLGLRKIQLLELPYRLAEGTLRGMQNEDKIESNRLSDSKAVDFIIIITIIVIIIIISILLLFIIYFSCFFISFFFFKIYLFLQGTVKQHNIHRF